MAYPNRMLKRLALTAFLMVFLMACSNGFSNALL